MGCANSKESSDGRKDKNRMSADEVTQQEQGQQQQQGLRGETPVVANQSTPAQAPAVKESKPPSAGVGGLNVLNADKVNIKDIVERESFHSVYTLGETLGKGNYSVVKKATKKGTSEVFAVKCIKEENLTHEDREALKIETAILKGMDSPHIIKLYGFYVEEKEKMYYIVTEFVGGGELFDRIIAKEFYSEEDAQKLVRAIAAGIQYCHERGVVHRDLKPENILLISKDDDDSIKIADFGFAKQYDTSSDDALSTSCGTPGYVAPEILSNMKYGKEVDMWSFGVIIYILLCGYPPFHHENQKELFRQIRAAKYEFEEDYWGQVSEDAKDLIRKLLIVDPSKRLTIEQLLEHTWVKNKATTTSLSAVKPGIQNIINKRRLKAGVQAVIAQNRIKKLVQGAQEAADQLAKEAAATPAPAPAEAPAAPADPTTPATPATAVASQ